MPNNEEHKNCYFCKHRKAYYGISYCAKDPNKPVQFSSFPRDPKCYEKIDYKHNHTLKPTDQVKEKLKTLGNPIELKGKCKDGCRYYISHLNYCTAFGEYCDSFECYYLL